MKLIKIICFYILGIVLGNIISVWRVESTVGLEDFCMALLISPLTQNLVLFGSGIGPVIGILLVLILHASVIASAIFYWKKEKIRFLIILAISAMLLNVSSLATFYNSLSV